MSSYDYLYYPYINFRSETWLKKMALYADSVSRIVPDGYPTRPSHTLDLLVEEHFVRNFSPWEAGDQPARVFSDFLIENQELLRTQYAIDTEQHWSSDLEDAHIREEATTNRAYVEASKLDGADLEAMIATGLVVHGRGEEINWIGMHPRLANTFMTLLMNGILADEPHLQPVADFGSNAVDVHVDSKAGLTRALLPYGNGIANADASRDAFVAFAFQQVLPANIATLDIHEIWALRERFADELGRFQKAVAAFVTEHKHLDDIKNRDRMILAMATKYEQDVQPTLTDLQKAFKGIGIKTLFSSMGVTLAAPGALTALGLAFNPVLAGIAGGALAVAEILHTHESAREAAIKRCEYSWLYRLETELAPSTLTQEIRERATTLWRRAA
ncbi:MAG: hypothetical protein KZQ99_04810 [Candidatus Thiodiazotropha sp. (ex Dulcina madagascariensis)]|nr:hypothetical protein [Candidatus Thiodiazotropha sp. (ex Dulcina madagascariensis)]